MSVDTRLGDLNDPPARLHPDRLDSPAPAALLRTVLNASMDGVLIVDRGGDLIEANPAACRLLGVPRDTLIGSPAAALAAEGAPREVFSRGALAGEGERFIPHFRLRGRGSREGEIHVEMTLAPFMESEPLLLVFVRDITERRRLERDVLDISDREQRRIGQDLHDSFNQHLTAISFSSQMLRQKLAARGLSETADADKILALMNQVIVQTRTLARGLHPVELERKGLTAAFLELVMSIEHMFGVVCRFENDPRVEVTDLDAATHLYRIAQEAVSNAVRHGRARNIRIRFERAPGMVTLVVADDGAGFHPAAGQKPGMGLRIMRYRARMINAELALTSPPEGGTTLRCRCPESILLAAPDRD
ncbi:MAG: PAS domain-containing protein [bacterium]|nr:PAS domain-containing protein [bacterium]